MEQTIKITIDKQGQATVEAEGFVGPGCTEKTREILNALGPKRDKDQTKPEFWQSENEQSQTTSN